MLLYHRDVELDLASNIGNGLRRNYLDDFIKSKKNDKKIYETLSFPDGIELKISAYSYPKKYCLDHLLELDEFVTEQEAKRIKKSYPEGTHYYNYSSKKLVSNEEEVSKKDKEITESFQQLQLKFPHGCERFKGENPSAFLNDCLLSKEKIERFEKDFQLSVWYNNWRKSQLDFAQESRALRDERLSNWGCYYYNVSFEIKNELGQIRKSDYKVWQMFNDAYCTISGLEPGFDYDYYESCKRKYSQLKEFKSYHRSFVKSVYDKILSYIDNFECDSPIVVYFASNELPETMTEKHFSYLKEELENREIFGGFLNAPEVELENSKCIIIELITSNDNLKTNCESLIRSHKDWFEENFYETSKTKEAYLDIVYISLLKEYDRKEMVELIDEEKTKREEEKKIQNYIDKYKCLAKDNPNGFKNFFPNLNPDRLSYDDAKAISIKKGQIEREESRLRAEIERQKRFANLSNRLSKSVSSWNKIGAIPHYFFFWYYPKKWWGDDVSSHSQHVREMIYDFKDGIDCDEVVDIVGDKLLKTFGDDDVESLVVVGIPASKEETNRKRYRRFLSGLESDIDIINGFSHVWVTEERHPARLGGTRGSVNYAIDDDWFEGKYVVIFDDIVTKGASVKQFASILQNAGATVICALSIGKTFYTNIHGHTPLPDPWVVEQFEE